MSHKIIQKMPSVEEIIARHPLSQQAEAQIVQDRKEIGDILCLTGTHGFSLSSTPAPHGPPNRSSSSQSG